MRTYADSARQLLEATGADGIAANPMARMRPPVVPDEPVPVFTSTSGWPISTTSSTWRS